jgi:ribonucleotide monophosphatase NagD (HAD superfamily)
MVTGAGTMVAAVSCSVQKEPIVVGKPSSFLMDFLLKRFAKCTHNKNNICLSPKNVLLNREIMKASMRLFLCTLAVDKYCLYSKM